MPHARCPACKYDLSGAVSTWTHASPIELTCPECGKSTPTRALFFPGVLKGPPPWSVEHVDVTGLSDERAIIVFLKRVVLSAWMALRPWKLWTELRQEHPVNPGPLLLFLFLGGILINAACGLLDLAIVVCVRAVTYPKLEPTFESGPWISVMNIVSYLWSHGNFFLTGGGGTLVYPHRRFDLAVFALTGIAYAILVSPSRRELHALRAWVYTMVALPISVPLFSAYYMVLIASHEIVGKSTTSTTVVAVLRFFSHVEPIRDLITAAVLFSLWTIAGKHYLNLAYPRLTALIAIVGSVALVGAVGYAIPAFRQLLIDRYWLY